MTEKDWVTLSCRGKDHKLCPGWFREDVIQPWSNAICACPCHLEDRKAKA